MAFQVRVPKLGMSVDSGTIVEWFVEDGARIEEGQPLYTLGTDKTDTEIEAPASGVIRIIGKIDEEYEVGAVIAEISTE
jgi:pyruvate/2-oxoglutarate dehydrogenase complex dihydrolipoamide acyltransferase (E2) component